MQSIGKTRLALEDAINAVTAEADTIFGHQADDADARYGRAKDNATVNNNWHDGAGLMTTLTLITYRMLWHLIGLFLPLHLRWRAHQGKEIYPDFRNVWHRFHPPPERRCLLAAWRQRW